VHNRIAQALTKLFDRYRIVFWCDVKQELRDDFAAINLEGVEKIELANNEFAVKYRVLREEPEQKFLLYREGEQPDTLDNWLLDLELAYGEFRTDQVAIWLAELELSQDFADVVQEHAEFYQAVKRRQALQSLLAADDTHGVIRLKMVAVCAASEPRLDGIVENLLQELADDRQDRMKLIERCGLAEFFWALMNRNYGYQSAEPGIRDFVVELFKSCYAAGTDGQVTLLGDALVFLKRWKDSRRCETAFETLSGQCAEVLGIEQDLHKRDFRTLLELDYFRLIDQKIIIDLVREVAARTVTNGDVAIWVRQRRQGHWYDEFRDVYQAVDYAAQFLHAIGEARLDVESLADGIQRYCSFWYQLDQLYRKYIYHLGISGKASLMSGLTEQVENYYSNNFLAKVNNNFQYHVDTAKSWEAPPIIRQNQFFNHWVEPFLRKENKVCVIISDALRYEIGDELVSRIRQEDRYSAELAAALAMLPSYTQLGMAALLPNRELMIATNDTATVMVDGQSSQGNVNRGKIIGNALSQRGSACKADEVMAMKGDDCRTLIRDHDVLYIYHNRIDATGDKRESEGRVFAAVEETLGDLIRLIKKLTAANISNILVTADHGFIYQNRAIDEADFSGVDALGEMIFFRDRRFVIGRGLNDSPSLRSFNAADLGLTGEYAVQIPKSINRLRLKGSGSRFVHGGATLQEVVIPVIRINKKRQSDVTSVEVDILRGPNSVITSGLLAVTLYQTRPAEDKVQPKHLRAGIYTEAGTLISERHDLTFDLTSDNPRERELLVRFVLTRDADAANGQEVILKLEEKVAGTSHYKEYRTISYIMRRSITSDFDF
jgi:uncharacterized protein (TIGR02687 family)